MLKLLRKDVLLNRRGLAASYAAWSAFWLGYPALRPAGDVSFNAWAVMVSLACAFLPIMVIAREDKFKAGALACSLPVTREAIAASRYVGGWLVALAGVAIAAGAMTLLSAAGTTKLTPPAAWLPIAVFVTIGLVLAVFLPFTLRFGITGVFAFLVLAQLLGIVTLLLSAMFGRGAGLGSAIDATVNAVAWTRAALGPVAFCVAVVAAVLALNVASYRVSAWIYRRREF